MVLESTSPTAVTTVKTHTILHPRIEVNAIQYFHDMTKSVYNRTQVKKFISRHPICLTDSDYGYILEEIGHQYKIEFEEYVEVYSNYEEN